MATYVGDIPTAGSVESILRQAATAGLCADADFATDEATTLANIATRNNTTTPIHSSLRSLYNSLVYHVSLGFRVLGATIMITDLATIYAACDGGDWQGGFSSGS